ncbi:MAG: hypothetical protein EPN92_08690 [Chitinophagaceae bacterium]|nr:MAG: hypothetical protein EPN92_08690 [Chitinophagaceae bacterium]
MRPLLLYCFFVSAACNQNTYNGVNLSKFVGSPIKEFITQPQFKSFKSYYWNHEPPALLYGITFEYSDNTFVEIRVDKFEHMNNFDTNLNWKLDDILREKASEIVIYKYSKDNDIIVLKKS